MKILKKDLKMCDFYQSVDVLKFASQVLGKTKSVKINSNIKSHSSYQEEEEDCYKIKASHDKPITLDKLILTFEKINKQYENADEERSYFYEGFDYNKNTNMWEIHWGS